MGFGGFAVLWLMTRAGIGRAHSDVAASDSSAGER
jgi:hypothetical protein